MPNEPKAKVPRIPELVGATSSPFELKGARIQIDLPIQEPSGPASKMVESLADWEPRRVFLNIEKMIGPQGSPPYSVYLNAPPDAKWEKRPDLLAGDLPMFGLLESSISDAYHSPNGLYEQLEITGLYARLPLLENWDPTNLKVTFVPKYPGNLPTVTVNRITLYFA